MRFTRLRKQIESGSLAGTQGQQEPSGTTSKRTKIPKAEKKGTARKGSKKEPDTKADMFKQEQMHQQPRMRHNDINEIPEVEELDFDIKMEVDEKNDGFGDSYGLTRLYGEGPGAEDDGNGDEDVPLAKKRKMAAAMLGMAIPPAKPNMEPREKMGLVVPHPQNRAPLGDVKSYPHASSSNLAHWYPAGPAGLQLNGRRPSTYDGNRLDPPMDDNPKTLGPFHSIMSDNPPVPCDPVVKNSHLCNPDVPAIKITDLDSDKPTADCSKDPEKALGTVEERINHDLFGPKNAHLWLPKKRDPVITLPPGRSKMEVPVIALIEEHERQFGNGKK